MSVPTGSLGALAVSMDGSLGGRIRDSMRSAGSAMVSTFIEDRQRHEAIACGVPTISKDESPRQDIESMVKKLQELVTSGSGSQR